MYRQINEQNTKGIQKDEYLPGFAYVDGVRFDPEDEANLMMEPMAMLLDEFIGRHNITSILDVGSGSGSLAWYLRQMNPSLSIVTLDGNVDTVKSPFITEDHHFVVRTDQDYQIVDKDGNNAEFDLIISFEHLEHIQEENFVNFLQNIKNHSHDKTFFIATAAKWEYENEEEKHIHCNVKTIEEWHHYMKANSPFAGEKNHSFWDIKSILKKHVAGQNPFETWTSPTLGARLTLRMYDMFVMEPGENMDQSLVPYTRENASKVTSWGHRITTSLLIFIAGQMDHYGQEIK